eukprot:TRINITY_DN1206_c0_g4_i1.p1 TRINITY_DN1206_c0_g4~~TRINITY_DN1206_c0_g4_i1.p1  ORF type:complete len:473 (-),score=59.88 TRINITY_DN1206_c0_g4_i1:36-1454(-)
MSWSLLKQFSPLHQPSRLLLKHTFSKALGLKCSYSIDLERLEKRLFNQLSNKERKKQHRRSNIKAPSDTTSFKPNRAVASGVNENEGMTLTFLGTSAGGSTLKRNSTSLALEMFDEVSKGGSVWLVDCGEGTLVQLAKAGIRITRINKIFITHLHLDHVGGLTTLLTSLSNTDAPTMVDLYGPPGIYHFIACNIICTSTHLANLTLRIHEFRDVQEPEKDVPPTARVRINKDPSLAFSIHKSAERNLPIERFTLDPTDDVKIWKIFESSNIEIFAGMLRHSVPCWGYVFQEKNVTKKMIASKVDLLGIKFGPIRRWMKDAPYGQNITIPAGEESGLKEPITINTKEYQELTYWPRKAVILGDTCDSSSLLKIGKGADVLVHEATVTEGSQKTIHNHSSPKMAGVFATKLEAKTLILTHLSKKFGEDMETDSLSREAGHFFYGDLIVAYDFFQYNVPRQPIDEKNYIEDKEKT